MSDTLTSLTLDLFLLGHAHLAAGQAGDGYGFEQRVRSHLDGLGFPAGDGFRVLGRRSLSGLYHQFDTQTACGDALVVGEWKAYRGTIPKNHLLRFKAATDDYWMVGGAHRESQPVLRIFGGTGRVTEAMRAYAAQAGIILVTPDRWPVPVLCDLDPIWRSTGLDAPGPLERRTLMSLFRPMDSMLAQNPDGGFCVPPPVSPADMSSRLRLWERTSNRAWQWWDDVAPSRFEALLGSRCDIGWAA